MKKVGTGTAQKIWRWWISFHNREVRNQGIVGILKGIFPFIIALIGTIIIGVIDVVIELFTFVVELFNQKDDDNARELINVSSCEELRSFDDERIVTLINSMLDGPTGDDDENAMLKLFGCLPCKRLSRIVSEIGLSNIQSEFHGSEFDELQLILGNCGIISFSSWDDDTSRLFINRSNCEQLSRVSNDNIIDLIRNMMSGTTGDADENAILKILGCLPCDILRSIVERIGRSNLEDEFHGSEFDRLRVLLGNCGIISFSSWDDDATRVFIGSSDCATLDSLSLDNITALLKNLFGGFTGGADERAIIKLIQCLNADTVRELISRPGFSKSDFEDEVDGDEWSTLRRIFNEKGV